jgi:hypothetical protein
MWRPVLLFQLLAPAAPAAQAPAAPIAAASSPMPSPQIQPRCDQEGAENGGEKKPPGEHPTCTFREGDRSAPEPPNRPHTRRNVLYRSIWYMSRKFRRQNSQEGPVLAPSGAAARRSAGLNWETPWGHFRTRAGPRIPPGCVGPGIRRRAAAEGGWGHFSKQVQHVYKLLCKAVSYQK